jgi:23S rRNA pseudouridine1911/1915/1917 synthase
MTGAPGIPARHSFRVDDDEGTRLDLLVARRLDLSRTQAATLIANGNVTVNGKRERSSFRAERDARVDVDVPPPPGRTVTAESIPVSVAFEDEYLLVIDKPAGMVVHPAPGNWSGTLVNALLGRNTEAHDLDRAGLVHRLDKDTSGLIIVAKDERTIRRLSGDLAGRRIVRRYAALVRGHLDSDRQRVDAALARDPRNRKRMAIVTTGRRAVTDFVRIARFGVVDLVRAHLHSGRTHQIRVHLSSIGHPVVGDATYGGAGAGGRPGAGVEGRRGAGAGEPERRTDKGAAVLRRQFLHAAWLRFRHPITETVIDLRSELPPDLRQTLARAADDDSLIDDAAPLARLGFFSTDT